MKTLLYLTILVAVVLAALRFSGVKDDVFKDIAHLFIGLCIGITVGRQQRIRWLFLLVAIVLTFAVEVPAFLMFRK